MEGSLLLHSLELHFVVHQPYTQVENQQSLVDLYIKLENKKIILKNTIYTKIHLSDLSSIATVRGLTLSVHLHTRRYSFSNLLFFFVHFTYLGLEFAIHRCMLNKLLVIKVS